MALHRDSLSVASVFVVVLLLLLAPSRAFAQPPAGCTGGDDSGYTCTIVANNQPVSLPFFEQTDDNNTAYVVFCAYESECAPDNAYQWIYVLAFTNAPDTQAIVYVNANPYANNEDFCDPSGYCIPTGLLAESTCDVYDDYCPGETNPSGGATFTDGTNTIIIVAEESLPPIINPCFTGVWCDTSGIIFNATAGTQITVSATVNTPNISFVEPATGTYTLLTICNTTYAYTATFSSGKTVSGTVTTGNAYGTVTVVIKAPSS